METTRADKMAMTTMASDPSTIEDTALPVTPTQTNPLSTEIDPAHVANDDNIILHGCPPVRQILCDPVNAFAEILSFADEDLGDVPSMVRVDQTSPRSTMDGQACTPQTSSQQCLTPRTDQACQRRGRFIIWPASLTSPSLGQREGIDA